MHPVCTDPVTTQQAAGADPAPPGRGRAWI